MGAGSASTSPLGTPPPSEAWSPPTQGGIHVIRHGPMRARLAGLEVVLADGTIATRLSGLIKDNVGYDLAQIMAGSEGTLGVVTKVALHLVPLPRFRVTALVALRGPSHSASPQRQSEPSSELAVALALSAAQWRGRPRRHRARLRGRDGARAGGGGAPRPPDPGAGAWLLVEASGARDPTEMLAEAVDGAEGVSEVAVADEGGRAVSAVGLPRAPHRGDRDARRAPQARCHLAARPAGWLHRLCTRGGSQPALGPEAEGSPGSCSSATSAMATSTST